MGGDLQRTIHLVTVLDTLSLRQLMENGAGR